MDGQAAIGRTDDLPRALRRAFDPRPFDPLPPPGRGDWLDANAEPGQTFDDFVRGYANLPDPRRKTIYLQPLGDFPAGAPSIEALERFGRAFFMLDVRRLDSVPIDSVGWETRPNSFTKRRQILAPDILEFLHELIPPDAYCVLGVTMEDLYPGTGWNYVFGLASLRDRVAVYSFARYDPLFWKEAHDEATETLMLRRSCKVLAHETSHMFGIAHCIYYRCVLNGSNHLSETDARPMHLCPVDLRKLQWSVEFDVVERYRRLEEFCAEHRLVEEAAWIAERLREIEA